MSERFDQLQARHNELTLRAALERRQLAGTAAEIKQRLGAVDQAVNIMRGLARNPIVIAGGVAVLAMIGPRRLLRWASHSALLVTTARSAMRLTHNEGRDQRPRSEHRVTAKITKST
ncbi:MAG: YqjK family protein [Steroidobacter sp.]